MERYPFRAELQVSSRNRPLPDDSVLILQVVHGAIISSKDLIPLSVFLEDEQTQKQQIDHPPTSQQLAPLPPIHNLPLLSHQILPLRLVLHHPDLFSKRRRHPRLCQQNDHLWH